MRIIILMMQPINVTRCYRHHLYKKQVSDKYVPAATMVGYQVLSDLERGVVVGGAREIGHSIFEIAMKFAFLLTTISRMFCEYRIFNKTSNLRHRCSRKIP